LRMAGEALALCSAHPALAAALVWLAWATFGFLHGGHWLVVFFLVARSPAERRRALLHFALYIVGILLTLLGGGYVRLDNVYRSCANETGDMGRDCLWQVQAADYQVVYVAHYIGLAWCAVSWVYDAVQLPGWLRKVRRDLSPRGVRAEVCVGSAIVRRACSVRSPQLGSCLVR